MEPVQVQRTDNHFKSQSLINKPTQPRNVNAQSRHSLSELKIYNLEDKEITSKKISLDKVQSLLGQKKFVKDMLNQNPEFLKIVTDEVKLKVSQEIKGNSWF